MKFLQFYKLYDWILEELGASTDAALIAIIFSFEENKEECRMSYSQFAEILKVNRCNAMDRIRKLTESGYISCTTNGTKTNTYKVNKSAFFASGEKDTSTSGEKDTSKENNNNKTSGEKDTRLVAKTPLASIENATSTSGEKDTQKENKENLKRDFQRENCARARANAGSKVILLEGYKQRLQNMITNSRLPRTLDSYITNLENALASGKVYSDHYKTLRDWIECDILKAEAKAKENRKSIGESSNSIPAEYLNPELYT